jgi:hypothetical protein
VARQQKGHSRTRAEGDRLTALRIGGDARADPLRILIGREIVNDTVGGKAVAVTDCPLCNSGLVFDRAVGG